MGIFKALTEGGQTLAHRFRMLRQVIRSSAEGVVTDEASLCEEAGIPVRVIAGDKMNIKITTLEDLALAETLFTAATGDA